MFLLCKDEPAIMIEIRDNDNNRDFNLNNNHIPIQIYELNSYSSIKNLELNYLTFNTINYLIIYFINR